jgi:hypothetical protein
MRCSTKWCTADQGSHATIPGLQRITPLRFVLRCARETRRSTAEHMVTENFRDEELLADTICRLIGDVRHVAVGASSPIPATAALMARERAKLNGILGKPYVSLLGSRAHTFFTDGSRELFDCAGQGRIDVFFLSG